LLRKQPPDGGGTVEHNHKTFTASSCRLISRPQSAPKQLLPTSGVRQNDVKLQNRFSTGNGFAHGDHEAGNLKSAPHQLNGYRGGQTGIKLPHAYKNPDRKLDITKSVTDVAAACRGARPFTAHPARSNSAVNVSTPRVVNANSCAPNLLPSPDANGIVNFIERGFIQHIDWKFISPDDSKK